MPAAYQKLRSAFHLAKLGLINEKPKIERKKGQMRIILKNWFLSFSTLSLFGCATVGAPFHFAGPPSVTIGTTTEKNVLDGYGKPFRVGFENGSTKWTYGYYQYRLFGDSDTKDLTFTFDKRGVVTSYSYSSSEPLEVKRAIAE